MTEPATTRAFYAARPTISVDGNAVPELGLGLISLLVSENSNGLYRCEATFGNWGSLNGRTDFLYFDRALLDFGRELSISIGDGEAAAEIFKGSITAIEGRFPQQNPPEILLLAEDSLQDLRMVRRTRHFDNSTVGDVISTIASDHSLNTDLDIDETTFTVLCQVNQSDLAFIRECARLVDAEVWVEQDTLHAQARSRRRAEEISMTYGQRLREFSVTADLATQRTQWVVSGWDVAAKDAVAESVDSSAIQGELDGGDSGSQLLHDAFGERIERVVHQVPFSTAEARSMAESGYRSMARKFVCGRAMSEGDGRLRVGAYVDLDGVGPLFGGSYYISEATHSFDVVNGYRTHFCVERPGMGAN